MWSKFLQSTMIHMQYNADADVNFDGVVSTISELVYGIPTGTVEPRGWITSSVATGPDNSIGYAGYVFNKETAQYTVRFRNYNPELGRWMQRDPAGYVDGANIYEYVQSSPGLLADPFGLES